MLGCAQRKPIFSTFDLTSGYFQVRLNPDDSEKTAFLTRMGSFKFVRMSMGLCNAGSTFSRIMQVAMQGLDLQICLCYLDDVIVHGRDVAESIGRLKAVFQRLREAGLKLKPSKCHLLQEEVAFLGHRVSAAGVSTDPGKIETVEKWPRPNSIHDVRAFVGLCSYYRCAERGSRVRRTFAPQASSIDWQARSVLVDGGLSSRI